MYFNTDILIKRNKNYFNLLKEELDIDYIDSYMISGFLGFKHKQKIIDFDVKEDDQNELTIPRTVLNNRSRKIDFLWSMFYMLENPEDTKDFKYFKKVFESNDEIDNGKYVSPINIDRVSLFHQYALAGVEILYDKTLGKSKREGLDIVECLNDLLLEIAKDDDYNDPFESFRTD